MMVMNKLDKSDLIRNSYSCQEINEIASNSPDFYVRLCFIDYVEDEDVLKSIASDDYSTEVCIKSMGKIGDADFLADICLNHPDVEVRLAALNRILDDSLLKDDELNSLLEDIVFNDPEYFVCRFACRHLSNQEALLRIIELSGDEIISGIAVSKITDEEVLIDLALNSPHDHIRREAIDNPNLKDNDALSEIILKEDNEFNRYWACGKITDRQYLLNLIFNKSYYHCLDNFNRLSCSTGFFKGIYENDEDEYRRQVAVHFINDGHYLESVFSNESNDDIRLEAIKNSHFNNQRILNDILKNEKDSDILSQAISKIDDISIPDLVMFSQRDNPKLRYHAIKRIAKESSNISVISSSINHGDVAFDFLMDIILNEKDKKIVFEALEGINDDYYLSKIVLQSTDREVRLKAIERIKAESLLDLLLKCSLRTRITSFNQLFFESNMKHIALKENDDEIRQIAITKINDITFLEELASRGGDDSIIARDMLDSLFEEISSIEYPRDLEILAHSKSASVSKIAQELLDDWEYDDCSVLEIQNISDIDELKGIAADDFNYLRRSAAEDQIEKILFHMRLDEISSKANQKKLKNIYEDESFTSYIRHSAFLKVTS